MVADIIDKEPQRSKPLKAQFRIGCKASSLNYSSGQTVFHIDDSPADKLSIKREVQQSLKSKILHSGKSKWDISTDTGEKLCIRRSNVNAANNRVNMYAYNYRAEKLPSAYPMMKPKSNKFNMGILEVSLKDCDPGETLGCDRIQQGICKRTEELPNHESLRDKTAWRFSTEVLPKEKRANFVDNEEKRIRNSKTAKSKIQNYKTPVQRHKEMIEKQREEKATLRPKGLILPPFTLESELSLGSSMQEDEIDGDPERTQDSDVHEQKPVEP